MDDDRLKRAFMRVPAIACATVLVQIVVTFFAERWHVSDNATLIVFAIFSWKIADWIFDDEATLESFLSAVAKTAWSLIKKIWAHVK